MRQTQRRMRVRSGEGSAMRQGWGGDLQLVGRIEVAVDLLQQLLVLLGVHLDHLLDVLDERAAVALAELTRRPQEPDDPIAELDFGSPVCVAPFAPCVWSSGRRVLKPLRPELEHRMCELPCVHVGMPMTAAQRSLALVCSMPLACPCALPCAPVA